MGLLDVLPDESVLSIAELLDPADLSRFLRTDSRFHSLIVSNFHRLRPFSDLVIEIFLDEDHEQVIEFTPSRLLEYRKRYEVHFVDDKKAIRKEKEEPFFASTEGRVRIQAFEVSKNDEDCVLEVQHNASNVVDAAKALLRLFRRRVSAHKLYTKNMDFRTIRALAPYFLPGLRKVSISNTEVLPLAELDLLEVLNHWLDLEQFRTSMRIEDHVSADFFKNAHIRRLRDIRFKRVLKSDEEEDAIALCTDELSDELLLALRAEKITLGPTLVTREGLKKFIFEWSNREREIAECEFGIDLDEDEALNDMLEEIGKGTNIEESGDDWITLKRADGAKLEITLSREFETRPRLVTVELVRPKPPQTWSAM